MTYVFLIVIRAIAAYIVYTPYNKWYRLPSTSNGSRLCNWHQYLHDLSLPISYAVNGISRLSLPVSVLSLFSLFDTGKESGLHMTLNIQQFESMPGPQDAAGIKLLIHDSKEVPTVLTKGQAFSPGNAVFVGLKFKEVRGMCHINA